MIHLAANVDIREDLKDPDAFWENNVVKSKPIFDYCRENEADVYMQVQHLYMNGG